MIKTLHPASDSCQLNNTHISATVKKQCNAFSFCFHIVDNSRLSRNAKRPAKFTDILLPIKCTWTTDSETEEMIGS